MINRPLTVIAINTEEKQLLSFLKAGDQQALKTIFIRYHQELCRVAWRVLHDEERSKDVVQEVFLKFWLKRSEIDIRTSLGAYLKRAVVNSSINALQQHKTASIGSLDVSEDLLITSMDTHENMEYQELNALASQAIDELPVRTKTVFQLVRLEGMSYREVSGYLDISEKAVEKEMMRALRLLREALKDYLIVLIFLKIFI